VRRHSPRILVTILLTFVASLPLTAHAWGSDAHRLIAEVAETQLTAAARAEVSRLLALEPGSTLASISTWADEHRSLATAALHYVNLPRDGREAPLRDAKHPIRHRTSSEQRS
jgi:hypothetical protein